MSFDSNTITLKRKDTSAGQNAVGEVIIKYTKAARKADGVPLEVKGRPTVMNSHQRIAYGVSATKVGWIVRTTANPKVDGRDQLSFTDKDGATHTVRVMQKSYRRGETSRIYRIIGKEDQTET